MSGKCGSLAIPRPLDKQSSNQQYCAQSADSVSPTNKRTETKTIPAKAEKPSSPKQTVTKNTSQNTLNLELKSVQNKNLSEGKVLMSEKSSLHHSPTSEDTFNPSAKCAKARQQKENQVDTQQPGNQKHPTHIPSRYQETAGQTQRPKPCGNPPEEKQEEKSPKPIERRRYVYSEMFCSAKTKRSEQQKELVEVGDIARSHTDIKSQAAKSVENRVCTSGRETKTKVNSLARSPQFASSFQCSKSQNTLIMGGQDTAMTKGLKARNTKEHELTIKTTTGKESHCTRAHSAQTLRAEPLMITEENQDVCTCANGAKEHCICHKDKPHSEEDSSKGEEPTQKKNSFTKNLNELNYFHKRCCITASEAHGTSTTQPRYPNYLKPKLGNVYKGKTDTQMISKPGSLGEQPQSFHCLSSQNVNKEKSHEIVTTECKTGNSSIQEPSSNVPMASKENSTSKLERTAKQATGAAENERCTHKFLTAGQTSSCEQVMHSLGVSQTDKTVSTDTGCLGVYYAVSSVLPHKTVPAADTKNREAEAETTCQSSSAVDTMPSGTANKQEPSALCKKPDEAFPKPTTPVEKATYTLQSSTTLTNFQHMLKKWKNELLAMHANLGASSIATDHNTCPLCQKESETVTSKGYRSVQELRRAILQFKQSSECCHACKYKTEALKESDRDREQQPHREAQTVDRGHCPECHKLTALPVLQSLHFLLDDVNLLLDSLDILEYGPRDMCKNLQESPQHDVTKNKVKRESINKSLDSGQQAVHVENQTPRDSAHPPDVTKSSSDNKMLQRKGKSQAATSRDKSLGFLGNAFAFGRHLKRKVCSETANIGQAKRAQEKAKREYFGQVSAYVSDRCLLNSSLLNEKLCGELNAKLCSARNRKSEHNPATTKGHAGQVNKNSSTQPDGVKHPEVIDDHHDDRHDNHLEEHEATQGEHARKMSESLSPSGLLHPVEQPEQTMEEQLTSRSEEQSGKGSPTFNKYLVRYLKHIETRIESIQQEKEHSTKSQFLEGSPKLLVNGNVPKTCGKISEVSVSGQVSHEVDNNLKRIFTLEDETGSAAAQNVIIHSIQNISDSLDKLSCDNTNRDVPENNNKDEEAILLKEPDKCCLNTGSQVAEVKDDEGYKFGKAHTQSHQLVTQTKASDCTAEDTVVVQGQAITVSIDKRPEIKPRKYTKLFLSRCNETGMPSNLQNTIPNSPKMGTRLLSPCQTPRNTGADATGTDISVNKRSEESDYLQVGSEKESDSQASPPDPRLLSSPLTSAALSRCTSSCASVTGSEAEGSSVAEEGVQETFHTIDQTLQHLATLMGRSPQLLSHPATG